VYVSQETIFPHKRSSKIEQAFAEQCDRNAIVSQETIFPHKRSSKLALSSDMAAEGLTNLSLKLD
jgi:hypothetical protein